MIDIIVSEPNKCLELYVDGQWIKNDMYHSTRQFMSQLCLKNGTTLEGCYEASRILLDNAYKRPIYIGGACDQIFVPTSSIKNCHCTWISLNYLMTDTLKAFNGFGIETISEQRWQKHLTDGISLNLAIFKKDAKSLK